MDPYEPEGILPNVLRWVDRPGQAVRNLLRGRPGAAGRHILDFLGEAIDAPLPGDLIPAATEREDYVSGSELAGGGGIAADIGIGMLTDPLTYLSFGAVGAAKGALTGGQHAIRAGIPFMGDKARMVLGTFDKPMDPLSLAMRGADAGIKKVTGGLDKLKQTGTVLGTEASPFTTGYENLKGTIRRAAGAADLSPHTREIVDAATAAGSLGSKYWNSQVEDVLTGLSKTERTTLGKAFMGVDMSAGVPRALGDDILANIDTLADPVAVGKLRETAGKLLDISKRQFDEGVSKGLFDPSKRVEDYVQRQWYFNDDMASAYSKRTLGSSALDKRTLGSSADVTKFLGEIKDVGGLEVDIGRLMANRSAQQGRMGGQATAAKMVGATGTGKALYDSGVETVKGLLRSGSINQDEAMALTQAIKGMDPRTGMLKALAGFNRMVKGPMVYGVVIPKMGSMVRNKIGMAFQALAQPGAREQALPQLKALFGDIGRSFDEAYGQVVFGTGKKFARGDEIGKSITAIEDAMKVAKSPDEVIQILARTDKDAADALRHGLFDGFVSTEELVGKLSANPNLQKMRDIYDAPGVMFQTLEQRGRFAMYKNLIKRGKPPDEAARLTKDTMYDYGISSPENRALRDVLPFGQFMVKSIPQQAKLLSQQPAAAVGLAPLFYDPSGDEGPVYPYMQGRTRMGVGEDSAGNPLYLTGFGLPVESLDVLPNLSGGFREAGRDISQGMLSSTQPVLKSLGAWATGKDPYFGTPFGTYDKIPVIGEAGGIGRAYNVAAGTGFLEPLGGGILRQLGQATDSRKPGGARAADLLTGAKLVAVDTDLAQQRVITEYLESRPDINQYRTFYKQGEPDPEFSELMSELRKAKERVKEKRAAAGAASP